MITLENFKTLFPTISAASEWHNVLSTELPQFNITTPERIAAFLSQCAVETGGWKYFEENMNYTAKRMIQVWPNIFNEQLARQCDHNPQMVANNAYANRMGNGDVASGDGWKFRGRGPIHLTGRDNYTAFSKDINVAKILDIPDLLVADKNISILSALWFWDKNKLNVYADTKDIVKLTKRVNGGSNALAERKALFDKILAKAAV